MSSGTGILSRVLGLLAPRSRRPGGRSHTPRGPASIAPSEPGRAGATATVEIDPPAQDALRISYSPHPDGVPDAGEIVWTWVPYQEHDGRGKDRPVLVIGRSDPSHVFAVKLTSKPHDGDRTYLAIGSGPWDAQGRPSWVDVDQVYLVHHDGLRREAAALDRERFLRVAEVLHHRYGWSA